MNFGISSSTVLHNGKRVDLYGENLKIESSLIKCASYHPSIKILQIVLNAGITYAYFDVPKKTFLNFATAKSKGSFFNKKIKDKFQYKKIQD